MKKISLGRAKSNRKFNLLFSGLTILALVAQFLIPIATTAADAGFNSPANTHSPNGWSNAANAFSSNDQYATANSESAQQGYSSFGFPAIPAGSTINGIEITAEAKSSDANGCQIEVALLWNGSYIGMKTAAISGSDVVYTLGSNSDTWGKSWLANQFTSANFVARVSYNDVSGNSCSNGATVSLDHLQAKVYYTEPPQNPELGQSCGLDIALVLDSSGSIESSELYQMKNAFKAFVDVFLPGTPTQFSVTDFDTTATVKQPFTSNKTLLNSAINSVSSGGATNWEDGLLKAQSTFDPRSNPNLVIFASDGNPNKYNPNQGPGYNFDQAALDAAIVVANSLKSSGTRIIALGIGDGLQVANLEAISSADAVYTSDFSTLAEDLAELASQLCGGTITVTKYVDQTLADGWEFTIAGQTHTTGETGGGTGQTQAVPVLNGTQDVSEIVQGGYGLVDAFCSGAENNGTFSGNTISGIEVSTNDIVSCVFYNSLQCVPSEEVCDGLDNDCDGYVDEDISSSPTECGIGACASAGELICSQGQWVDTCQPGTPSDEICDNADNDCDGAVDEGLTRPTTCGLGICFGNQGYETCTAGEWGGDTCDPYYGAGQELCEGQSDENCDGAVDEGCECTDGSTQQCGQTDVGLCEYGTQTCSGGVWGSCEGAVYPAEEICRNDLDEDCDGSDLPCPCLAINVYKIVCQSESDLPNWGNGDIVTQITGTTASDYVAQHPNCHFESGWDFQWHFGTSNDPGNPGDNIGYAGSGWTTFGPTDSNGLATTDICSLGDVCDNRIWVREVTQEGYVPFSGDTTIPRDDDVSAEFYCHMDALNYDNYDFIINPQFENTYYCVGFNAPTPEPVLGCTDQAATNYNPEATVDDGSCTYPEEPVLGCTDPEATNYNPEATEDDGSCTYPEQPVYGCTDQAATNYNPEATVDDGSCTYLPAGTCPTSCGYQGGTVPDGQGGELTCAATDPCPPVFGCTDSGALNYNPSATMENGSCTYPNPPGIGSPVVYGCTHPEANNYNPYAISDDGSCNYGEVLGASTVLGCMDPEATNYDLAVTEDDGSCAYEEVLSVSCGMYLLEYLKYGADNDPVEVMKLQEFLNDTMQANLAVTGVYDEATREAVNAFQLQYKDEVLKPWVDVGVQCDVNTPTGYVFITTQRWINLIKCPTLNIPMPDLSGYDKTDCSTGTGEGTAGGEEVTGGELLEGGTTTGEVGMTSTGGEVAGAETSDTLEGNNLLASIGSILGGIFNSGLGRFLIILLVIILIIIVARIIYKKVKEGK